MTLSPESSDAPVSVHHEFIKKAIPDWLGQATPQRLSTLRSGRGALPDWASTEPEANQQALRSALAASWLAQNKVDKMFAELKDAHAFSAPLLRERVLQDYGVDVDVSETFLMLYTSSDSLFGAVKGATSRITSMLDAAIRNFASSETFLEHSEFISRPNAEGHFDIKPIRQKMSIEQFKQLCRSLDLGARYQAYLDDYLNLSDAFSHNLVRMRIADSHKCALKAALELARLNRHMGAETSRVVDGLIEGREEVMLDGAPVRFYHLEMMDTRLIGILLIAPDLGVPTTITRRVIGYVPHDPDHPLKEYPSSVAFLDELTRQLRSNAVSAGDGQTYHQFFSRFIAHSKRGFFFADLHQRLNHVIWHPREPGSTLPTWRETPIDQPDLRYAVVAFDDDNQHRFRGNVWDYLFEQQINKVFNDARELVISTGDADRAAFWHWIENLESMLSEVFNVALLVITPFVPFLGELMLAYTVYQLTYEVIEGVFDLAEGLYLQASEHLIGVAESVAQIAAFGAAAAVGKLALSPLIEGAAPVTLANGKQRLWSQDLEPYRQRELSLPADSQADPQGLHQYQGKSLLRLDSGHFELKKDPLSNEHRLQHPSRTDAYQPRVRSNGAGAFVIEGERPEGWDEQTLMTRLGPQGQGLEDAGPAVRTISGTPVEALRRMYGNNEPPLPLLSDTLARLRIDRSVARFCEQIASAQSADYLQADISMQLQLMDGLWPSERRVQVIARDGRTSLGEIGSSSAPRERVYEDRLRQGDVLQTLLSHLSEQQIEQLMVRELGASLATPEVNAQTLRSELAQRALRARGQLFERRYGDFESQWDAPVQFVRRQVPGLPGALAQELLAVASPEELQAVASGTLPTRLEGLASFALEEVRVARAYEGVYLSCVESFDTDKLVLHSLENLPGWPTDLQLEVRRYGDDGQLLDRMGPQQARLKRTIILTAEGDFEVRYEQGTVLAEEDDFHAAIMQALPDDALIGLGIGRGEVSAFKRAVREHLLAREALPQVLAGHPASAPPPYDPRLLRLRGGAPADVEQPVMPGDSVEESFQRIDGRAYLGEDVVVGVRERFRAGLELIHERFGLYALNDLEWCFYDVESEKVPSIELRRCVEFLAEWKQYLPSERFLELLDNLAQRPPVLPSTEQQVLVITARDLQAAGRVAEYDALVLSAKDGEVPTNRFVELRHYATLLKADASSSIVEVEPQTMANLHLAQRAISRSKELLPLSGNQHPSIWEKGGSAIAKLKHLRKVDLETGRPTANLTISEAAKAAIEIKGGNCSENSKVTFSILASQPRDSAIHIVAADRLDHQFVLIGDLNRPEELVVADSWPEFPVAHLASDGAFNFDPEPIASLAPGPAVAEYQFVADTASGQAQVPPRGTDDSTLRQIVIAKLHVKGAYRQWLSTYKLGVTYKEPQGQPVSFQRHDLSTIERRIDAYHRYTVAIEPDLERYRQRNPNPES